ncbi:MAG: hypothetical protein OQK75_13445 [Gammaproteobacteria bacterium]|nr:hypothetical protein [Gammaproteobacteria bacterium]MCW8988663.1 hypothetical protein [Gammaproteobacteria bacterium]MCW9031893.1 hypothetical protein [Gammaproteobacteria bacterium]
MYFFSNTKQVISFTLLLMLGMATVSCNAETSEQSAQSFSEFWKEFRISALNNDIGRISDMTRFPFSVKGELDMDGSVTLDKVEFQNRFKSFMEQDVRDNLTPESMREYIKKNKQISPRIDDGQTSVALFSFELINGKWYFVRVYVEEI